MPQPNNKYQENLKLLNDPRIQSLLKTIRNAEGATYNTRVGGKTFDDLSKKPGVMTRLPKLGINSSAEGAYQFLNKTWDNVSKDLGIKDFSPLSQDIAAVELIRRRGALDNILRGDFKGGINKLSPEWASLPTANGKGYYSGQKARRIDDLEKIYTGQKVPKGTYESFTSPVTYSHSKDIEVESAPELDSSPLNLEASVTNYEEPEVVEAKQDIADKSFQEDISKLFSMQQEQEPVQIPDFVPTDLTDAYNYIETDPGYNFEQFQNGGATRQDSLNVYNNSKKVQSFYEKEGYKSSDSYIFSDIVKEKRVHSKNDDVARKARPDKFIIVNPSLKQRIFRMEAEDYRKNIDKNKYFQREISVGTVNAKAPMQLFDRRIDPAASKSYFKEGDNVEVASYNSIANKPFNLLTEDEKKQRVEKYGMSGVPKSYINNKTLGETKGKQVKEGNDKDIVFTKTPIKSIVNYLQPAGINKISEQPIISNEEIPNQYIQPKYWDVQDNVNQNFGGTQTNYRITPETADSMLRTLAPEPYNSRTSTPYFQTGGSIDESKAFLENWYPNRVLSDPKLNSDYQGEKQLYINQSQNLPTPNYVDKIDDYNTQGTYDINNNQIELLKSSDPLVYTHEATHGINLPLKNTQSNVNAFSIIGQNILPQDKIQNQWVKDNYQQISNYQEVIPRLNSYRQLHGLKPDQVITPELIQSNRDSYNQGKIPFEDNTDQLYKMFENEGLSNVLNKVVSNEDVGENYFAQDGGFIIEDDMGQWAHPGEVTKINSSDITMKGVGYPVLGIDNLGNQQMMYPGQEYKFPGEYVIEYPQNKNKNNRFK